MKTFPPGSFQLLSLHLFLSLALWVWGKAPEASSTLLQMHRKYVQHPPHDKSLYNLLRVLPNATHYDISKAYRKISRQLHPDKALSDTTEQLQRVREAYDILKDDSSRLPYHLYGLTDMDVAIVLLKGRSIAGVCLDPAYRDLLHLMGYEYDDQSNQLIYHTPKRRIHFIAADLVERIRPLVEGVLQEQTVVDDVTAECNRLKHLPMGSHILRCIGRAYRYAGRRILRRYHVQKALALPDRGLAVTDSFRETVWNAHQFATAILASGRAAVSEHKLTRQCKETGQEEMPLIDYFADQDADDVNDIVSGVDDSDIRQEEHRKAQHALVESLQIEALWKISKMDLDRTIRQACDLILEKEYFFFPSDQRMNAQAKIRPGDRDGWVGSSGVAMDAQTGCVRAAAALVLMGETMVRCSKEGTSWRTFRFR